MVRLGVDLGTVRIGLATCDELGYIASPYAVILSDNDLKEDANNVFEVAKKVGAKEIVVGLPRNMNGTYGEAAMRIEAFCCELELVSGDIKIKTWDERMSTIQASRILIEADLSRKKRKGVVDKSAAAIILQGYIDRVRNQ